MAYARSAVVPRELSYPETATAKPLRRSLWRRLLDAIVVSRQLQADREIALYLQSNGGKFTDAAEREIEWHILSRPSR
jgi:hypothetical protein